MKKLILVFALAVSVTASGAERIETPLKIDGLIRIYNTSETGEDEIKVTDGLQLKLYQNSPYDQPANMMYLWLDVNQVAGDSYSIGSTYDAYWIQFPYRDNNAIILSDTRLGKENTVTILRTEFNNISSLTFNFADSDLSLVVLDPDHKYFKQIYDFILYKILGKQRLKRLEDYKIGALEAFFYYNNPNLDCPVMCRMFDYYGANINKSISIGANQGVFINEYDKKTGEVTNKIDHLVWSFKNNILTISYDNSSKWSSDKKGKVMMTLTYSHSQDALTNSNGEVYKYYKEPLSKK